MSYKEFYPIAQETEDNTALDCKIETPWPSFRPLKDKDNIDSIFGFPSYARPGNDLSQGSVFRVNVRPVWNV